tara:strand:- start:2167 stop:2865 length:699 start_codon:yes stop_codon:yes gene_type:complete
MLWFLLSCSLSYHEEQKSKTLFIEQTRAVHHYNFNKAIDSSLKIISYNDQLESMGHGSGNYFKIGKEKFIVTAAHLLSDDTVLYGDDEEVYIKLEPAFVDLDNDIAILKPLQDLKNTRAVDYRINTKQDLIGVSVVHAGYPSDLQRSVFNGMVSVCSKDALMMQSFALPGSSGSVVFDNSGKIVGLVSALKLGAYGYSPFPQLHETLVYVSRLNKLNRSSIKEILKKWKNSK